MSEYYGTLLWGRLLLCLLWFLCEVFFLVLCFEHPFEPRHPHNFFLSLIRGLAITMIGGGGWFGVFGIPRRLPGEKPRGWSCRRESLLRMGRVMFVGCSVVLILLIWESFSYPELLQENVWRKVVLSVGTLAVIGCNGLFVLLCGDIEAYTVVATAPVCVNGVCRPVGTRYRAECFRSRTVLHQPAEKREVGGTLLR